MSYSYLEAEMVMETTTDITETTSKVNEILKETTDKIFSLLQKINEEDYELSEEEEEEFSCLNHYGCVDDCEDWDDVYSIFSEMVNVEKNGDLVIKINTEKQMGSTQDFDFLTKTLSPLMKDDYTFGTSSGWDSREGIWSDTYIMTKRGEFMGLKGIVDDYFTRKNNN